MNRLPGLAFGCDKHNEMPYLKQSIQSTHNETLDGFQKITYSSFRDFIDLARERC